MDPNFGNTNLGVTKGLLLSTNHTSCKNPKSRLILLRSPLKLTLSPGRGLPVIQALIAVEGVAGALVVLAAPGDLQAGYAGGSVLLAAPTSYFSCRETAH